ncbi:hypothetical protein [Diaphorobacter aerolatus]|uniref:Uncharacterized protein n=1 Tax=Diaphorobacter aerolatus TaxID=1288495 RepID=A0A7H0GJD1_9BURK|nr:hypothetical protein [Diaphorobacter aerolatus]QNP48397.1 hypothetical protein H9K75_20980 [Diaphorobacter aerolatus]
MASTLRTNLVIMEAIAKLNLGNSLVSFNAIAEECGLDTKTVYKNSFARCYLKKHSFERHTLKDITEDYQDFILKFVLVNEATARQVQDRFYELVSGVDERLFREAFFKLVMSDKVDITGTSEVGEAIY